MAESIVQVTEGSGKKLHTFQRVIGANTVEDDVVVLGEQYLASYGVAFGPTLSIATANDHIFQLMAGASLNVYVRRIRVWQTGVATTTAIGTFEILRLSLAGTGGTARGIAPMDSSDAAAGFTVMTLPTVKGTEGNSMCRQPFQAIQTLATGGPGQSVLLADFDFDKMFRTKALRIAAGVGNGICLKSLTAIAAATVICEIWASEANF